jgi:LETM1 and EF-hand domain-containing protein 1
VIQKLDVDKDGFVELEHVLGLVKEEGLGEPFGYLMGM